jgi:hypothetical protein
METPRIQTVLRLKPELMERVRRRARKEKKSFNSYVEQLLERETMLHFPTLPENFSISEEILGLGQFRLEKPTEEELATDPKLACLWEKYGKE